MVFVEHAIVMHEPRYPELRLQVIAALESLSDPEYQRRQWGVYEEGVSFYDDLDLNVHLLYDDVKVLPEPKRVAPDVIRRTEVPALQQLESSLGPLLDKLGNAPDDAYIRDEGWHHVVEAAKSALKVMQHEDELGVSY